MPTAVGANKLEVAEPVPDSSRTSVFTEVKIGSPEQVALSGPNRVNVTVPVASSVTPLTVAVSLMVWPSLMIAWPVASVVTSVDAFGTVEVSLSSPHAPAIGLLLASPSYEATQ